MVASDFTSPFQITYGKNQACANLLFGFIGLCSGKRGKFQSCRLNLGRKPCAKQTDCHRRCIELSGAAAVALLLPGAPRSTSAAAAIALLVATVTLLGAGAAAAAIAILSVVGAVPHGRDADAAVQQPAAAAQIRRE